MPKLTAKNFSRPNCLSIHTSNNHLCLQTSTWFEHELKMHNTIRKLSKYLGVKHLSWYVLYQLYWYLRCNFSKISPETPSEPTKMHDDAEGMQYGPKKHLMFV